MPPRLGNARTIADIEFVIDAPSAGNDHASWSAYGVECSRDRHRFSSPVYAFTLELVHLRFAGPSRTRWYAVITTEQWRFSESNIEARTTKSLRVVHGRQADIRSWVTRARARKLISL